MSLVRVNEKTKKHIDNRDEKLCEGHGLPKVHGTTHLCHELDKNQSVEPINLGQVSYHKEILRATVGEDNLHDAVELGFKWLFVDG